MVEFGAKGDQLTCAEARRFSMAGLNRSIRETNALIKVQRKPQISMNIKLKPSRRPRFYPMHADELFPSFYNREQDFAEPTINTFYNAPVGRENW